MENSYVATSFPPHGVSPKRKSDKKVWGLQGARATWYASTNGKSPSLFFNDRDSYSVFLRYAFGQQDESIYKPALGISAKNEQNSFMGGIRWQIKNFATKRVQATVSRIFNRKYDPIATAIDPTSSDRRESFKASLKMWATHQEWIQERQEMIGVDVLPDGVDLSMLPENDEDLQIFMQDYKLNNEILTELGVKYHLDCLDFDGIKETFDQYLTILPVAGVWCGLDANNMPTIKGLNPSRVLAPRSEFKDYKRMGYCGYVDDFSVAEFRNLIGTAEYSKDEVDRMVETYAMKGDYHSRTYSSEYPETARDVDTIQVVHFEIPTVDEYTYLERKDKYGNDRFVEKPYDYYRGGPGENGQENPGMESFRKKYRTERKIHRVAKPTVYGGYWIVGSEVVFGYGEKNYLKGEVGYKLRASNLLSGRTTCLLAQMKPCLDNLETYDKKIQQLVASATPRIIKIDLFALRKASFKLNGKDMTTQDLLEMFFQTGVIITDTSDQGGAGDSRKPIETFKGGLSDDFAKYLDAMRSELEQLDEIIGYNRASSGSTLSPELGKGVVQQMDATTDINLDHLYRADRGMCESIYKAVAHLHRQSVIINPDYYVPILGEEAVAKILASVPFDEIGISVEAQPTAEQWNQFYVEINDLVKAGFIQPEDRVALRRFTSLKQSESYLRVVTRKRKKEKLQEQQMLIQENAKAQQQSNQQTAQNAMALNEKEFDIKKFEMERLERLEKIKHRNKMEEIASMNAAGIQEVVVEGEYDLKRALVKPAGN